MPGPIRRMQESGAHSTERVWMPRLFAQISPLVGLVSARIRCELFNTRTQADGLFVKDGGPRLDCYQFDTTKHGTHATRNLACRSHREVKFQGSVWARPRTVSGTDGKRHLTCGRGSVPERTHTFGRTNVPVQNLTRNKAVLRVNFCLRNQQG